MACGKLALSAWLLLVSLSAVHGGNYTRDDSNMAVVVVVDPPYTMHDSKKSGNDAFSGFLIDLFTEVATNLGVSQNFTFQKFDGQGSSEALSLLINDPVKVDMIVGPIIITKERLQLVDFTVPFISMPVTVVTRTREARKAIFGFFAPFHWKVWMLLLVMMVAYGTFVFVTERNVNNPDFPRGGWKALKEVMWHSTMVSLQDRDKQIKSAGGKIATATYSFTILIMLAAYTANLAATMSSEHIPEVVKGLDNLKSKVGAAHCGGAVEQYLVKNSVLGRIVCKYSNKAAAHAVSLREADAALMNRLSAQFLTSESCGLHVVPGIEIDNKPYAFPVQKGWIADYAQFNRWLVELVMDGTVDRLVKKWFSVTTQCRTRNNQRLDYDSFWGLEILLLSSAFIAGVIWLTIFVRERLHKKQAKDADNRASVDSRQGQVEDPPNVVEADSAGEAKAEEEPEQGWVKTET